MSSYLDRKHFKDVNLSDPFFDSLKGDYSEFESWFQSKADEEAYVLHDDGSLVGFMYVKIEDGCVTDVAPQMPPAKRVKIGTLKVQPHGTRLGDRLLKKAFDHAVARGAEALYVTVFPRHDVLIGLLEEFGFERWGTKSTANGEELVLVKVLGRITGDLRSDYPVMDTRAASKFVLSIYPRWHTQLFPDSILDNESYDILADVSHTNSIQKTYICFMDVSALDTGDLVVIYRTKDEKGPAWYRSVVTSVCAVEEVRAKASFASQAEYLSYTEPFSVFDRSDLIKWWNKGQLYVIKMLYNAAFTRRLIRKDLVERFGLDADAYWGFFQLPDSVFRSILREGGVNDRLVVD